MFRGTYTNGNPLFGASNILRNPFAKDGYSTLIALNTLTCTLNSPVLVGFDGAKSQFQMPISKEFLLNPLFGSRCTPSPCAHLLALGYAPSSVLLTPRLGGKFASTT